MKNRLNRFAEIKKVVKNDDGTLNVYGNASTELRDEDGEMITAGCMTDALPGYMEWGAVREMHQPKAAGTAISASVNDAGETEFACHVVDSEAVKKVEAGVYKGFSIGGKVTKRDAVDKTIITGLRLIEVSLVDRPSNPGAAITLFKLGTADMGRPRIRAVAKKAAAAEPETPATPAPVVEAQPDPSGTPAAAPPTPEPETATAKVATPSGDVAEKAIWEVIDLAYVLNGLRNVAMNAKWEAEYEGDNSPVPAKLVAALDVLGGILVEMTAEEVSEMAAEFPGSGSMLELAAKADAIQKKGAKFSKATRDALAKAHGAMKDCCDLFDSLAYNAMADDGDAEDDDADKLAKVAVATLEKRATDAETEKVALTKSVGDLTVKVATLEGDVATKAAELKVATGKLTEFQTKLTAAVETMKARGALRAVGKGDDSNAPAKTAGDGKAAAADPGKSAVAGAPDPDAGARAIASVHKSGGVPLTTRR